MSATTRARCIRLIEQIEGRGSVPAFLHAPQPDLDDMTGAELLQGWPERLLAHLEARQRELTRHRIQIDEEVDVDGLLAELREIHNTHRPCI